MRWRFLCPSLSHEHAASHEEGHQQDSNPTLAVHLRVEAIRRVGVKRGEDGPNGFSSTRRFQPVSLMHRCFNKLQICGHTLRHTPHPRINVSTGQVEVCLHGVNLGYCPLRCECTRAVRTH